MIDLNINSNYFEKAEDLFIPFSAKICSSKLTRLQFLIELVKEIIFFIPKSIQRKSFVEDYNKKINLIFSFEENLQVSDLDDPNFTVEATAKKLKQLNSLYSVHLLIKKHYEHTSSSKTEVLIKGLIIKNQCLINKHINLTEDKKINYQKDKQKENSQKSHKIDENNECIKDSDEANDLITKPIPSPPLPLPIQEVRHDESPILIDEQEKIIKTDYSKELSEKPENSQSLQPSLIETNNSDPQIEIHQPSETPPDNSENLWGRVKKWTGVRGLQTGVENVKNGNYVKGFCEIAFGSIRIALTAYVTLFVAQQIISGFKSPEIAHNPLDHTHGDLGDETGHIDPYMDRFGQGLEIPGVEKSQIQSESFNSAIGSRKITLITAYDEGIKDYAQYVIPNQRTFAAKNGYDYIEYYGNLAHDQGRQRAPYWSKIVAINDQLQKGKEDEWIAWGDASALFTNTKKNFDQIIEKHGSGKDIILTTDPQVPINNAVFLVKNTPWTKNWIKEVWARSDLAKGGEGNCWSWGQPFCHYEQQAMTELWQGDPEVQSHTIVIPNKEMNAFYRYSHYDRYRDMHQNYDGDPENSKWGPGDFICKVTGMDRDRRLGIIQHVANNCIDQNCDRIQV